MRGRSRMESEMDTELRFHIETFAEDLIRSGMPRQEAMRRARIEFGGIERVKEEGREARGAKIMETLLQDLRYGTRLLRSSPGFTAVAVFTLALGIGANAAIFGLADSAFLRSLPFREPERLVHVWTTDASGEEHTPSPAEYLALRKDSQAFEQVSGNGWADFFYGDDEASLRDLQGLLVTQNWLTARGIQPILGRNFLDDEETAGRDPAVILSYRCWRTKQLRNPRKTQGGDGRSRDRGAHEAGSDTRTSPFHSGSDSAGTKGCPLSSRPKRSPHR
jgi:putative ABC transport system permease protein